MIDEALRFNLFSKLKFQTISNFTLGSNVQEWYANTRRISKMVYLILILIFKKILFQFKRYVSIKISMYDLTGVHQFKSIHILSLINLVLM